MGSAKINKKITSKGLRDFLKIGLMREGGL
jgi:hypothetical protein